MSLPKKRKGLPHNPPQNGGDEDGMVDTVRTDTPEPPEQTAPNHQTRSRQMDDAFAIVDHMEHSRGMNMQDVSGMFTGFQQSSPDRPDGIRLRLSIGSAGSGNPHEYPQTDRPEMPVIEVKLKIPSFFWRVPILRNVTETIITRLAKG